jgi:dienelactone hydrolase
VKGPAEQVARFGKWRSLAGVVTQPAAPPPRADMPAVLLLNAGLLHHVGPNRLHVALARRLAGAGVRSLRFDLSGIGDSGVRADNLPRVESAVEETREAMDHLARVHGAQRFVLFGICAGAEQALRVAAVDSRVAGIVPVDGYRYRTSGFTLHHYRRRLFRARTWTNILTGKHPAIARLLGRRRMARAPAAAGPRLTLLTPFPPREEAEARLLEFADRGGQLLAIYTPGAVFNHAAQFHAMFPTLASRPTVRSAFLPHANHVFTLLSAQEALVAAVETWMRETFVTAAR